MPKGIGFEILLTSPFTHEQLVAEIFADGEFVAAVSQERGKGLFDLEMAGPDLQESEVSRRIEARGFIEAMERAMTVLSKA